MTTSEALSFKATSSTCHPPQALAVSPDFRADNPGRHAFLYKSHGDALPDLADSRHTPVNIQKMKRASQVFRALGNAIEKDIANLYVLTPRASGTPETRPSDAIPGSFPEQFKLETLEILKVVGTSSVTFPEGEMLNLMLPVQAVPYSGVHLEELVGSQSPREVYETRLAELEEAAHDEGICPPRDESKADFIEFLETLGFSARRAAVTLSDDGILRATWRDEKWRLGMSFLGNGKVDYVLLDRLNPPDGETGIRGFENFSVDCKRFDLAGLLADDG